MKKYFLALCIATCASNPVISQILLNESFDNPTFVPPGWYKAKIFPSSFPTFGQWERVTAGTNPVLSPHSGAAMARFDSPSAGFGTISELGTTVLNLSAGSPCRVRFWIYRGDNAQFSVDQLDIYISTQQNITGASLLGTIFISRMKMPAETANGWYQYTFDLPAAYNTATNYVIFRATGASSNVVYLDDVIVESYTCYKPVNTSVTNVTPGSATLNWNQPATGIPDAYEWELRSNGSAGTGATGLVAGGSTASTAIPVSGLTQGISYNFYVRSVCGTEKSTWTNALNFTTPCSPAAIPYTENFDGIISGLPPCTIAENSNGGNAFTSSLPLYGSSYANSAPNAAACSYGGSGASGAQNDWFYTAALSLETGKCYQLSFASRTSNSGLTQSLKVKLGTGQNAALMTLAELFNSTAISNSAYINSSVTFTVAATGVYYLGFNYYGNAGSGAILIDDIKVMESVGVPANINANPVGTTTAQLNWSAPSCGIPSSYEWELRTGGAAGSGAAGLTGSGNGLVLTTSFSGLLENTTYTFYSRAVSGTITGSWSSGLLFQTACSNRTLPYTENFDGVSSPAMPPCITREDLNVVYNSFNTWVNESNAGPNSSPNCMRVGTNNSSYAGNNWLFTPPFDLTAGRSYRLHFYYRCFYYFYSDKLEVKFGLGPNAAAMTSPAIFSNTDIRNSIFKEAVVDFVPGANGNYNIGFHYFSNATGGFLYLDDIKVEETPACDVVKDINAINISANAALLRWSAPQAGTPNSYGWELRTSGTAGSGATGLVNSGTLAAGTLSVPVNGLNAGTTYTFYIAGSCGAGNSEWTPYTFSAACAPVYVPYTENFDGVATPALPPCTRIEEKLDRFKWASATGISRSVPNALYHSFTQLSPLDDWFFTAPLQLTAGRNYTLSFYYRQEASGNADAIEFKIGRYAQSDSMLPAAIYTNTSVTSTAYQLATVNFTVPASGTYYLGLHSIPFYYSRGVAIDDISVNEISPDLFISNQSLGASTAATSETITANFRLNNQGLANAPANKTYFYLSADNILTPGLNGDTLIGFYDHTTPVNAGSNTGILARQLTIPCNLAPGNYTLFFVADAESVITEINETNNASAVPVAITEGSQWNGSVDNNWETAGNWSCNQVPGPSTNVIINSGTVVVNASTTIRSLNIKTGVNFTVAAGVLMTVLQ